MSDPQRLEKQETLSPGVKWAIELYPFANRYPKYNDFDGTIAPSVSVVTTDEKVGEILKSHIEQALNSYDSANDEFMVGPRKPTIFPFFGGVTNIDFSRTKFDPEPELRFSLVGPVPYDMTLGVWVVLTSVSGILDQYGSNFVGPSKPSGKTLVRFIGQISDIQVSYSEGMDGNLRQNSTIFVRSWSWALNCPIEYHEHSILSSVVSNAKSGVSTLGYIAAKEEKLKGDEIRDGSNKIQEFLTQAFNPFEFAQMILSIIGMASNLDRLDTIKALATQAEFDKLQDIILSTPSIPSALFGRLNIPTSAKGEKTAFSNFMRLATGPQRKPFLNNGWNGVFKQGGIEEYLGLLKGGYEQTEIQRPKVSGYSALSQLSAGAWQLINSYGDSSFYEYFTDIWYEEAGNGNVVGRPVFVARDKPFLIKGLVNQKWAKNENDLIDIWTKYDDIPRIDIPSSAINSFTLESSARDSPNYIQVVLNMPGFKTEAARAASAVPGMARLAPEMRRFGGKSERVYSSFQPSGVLDDDKNTATYSKWTSCLRIVYRAWHAYKYRMASGRLTIVDNNLAIPVGFNVRFPFGKYMLVGHVEGYSVAAGVDNRGLETTVQTINISRIMCEYNSNGDLAFIDNMGNLAYSEPPTEFGDVN